MKKIIVSIIVLCSLAAFGQVSVPRYELITATGTNTYAATVTPTPSLTNGFKFQIKFTNANSGASTLNVNGLGAVTLRKHDGTALSSGDIAAGSDWWAVYDGTAAQWRLLGGGGSTAAITSINAQTDAAQIITTDGTGTDVGVSSSTGTHTIQLPSASGSARGVLTSADWTTFNSKQAGDADLTSWAAITRGAGFDTWAANPSWTNFNSMITGTAPYWSLASGGTLTAANTITTNTQNWLIYTGALTATGNFVIFNPSYTSAGNATVNTIVVNPTYTQSNGSHINIFRTLLLAPTATIASSANITHNILEITGTGQNTTTESLLKLSGNTSGAIQILNVNAWTGQITIGNSTANSMGTTSDGINYAGGGSHKLFTGQGSTITNIPSFSFISSNYSTSTVNKVSFKIIDNGFTQSTGSDSFTLLQLRSTISGSGSYTGIGYGIDYAPTVTTTGTHIAGRFTSGQFLIGGSTVTASTRLDVRGIGTTTGNILRLANSANTARLTLTDAGVATLTGSIDISAGINLSGASSPFQVGGSAGTSGQVLTSAGAGVTPTWSDIGVANVVSPTAPNRTISIVIGGVTYYLHAKTTND